MYYSRIDVMEGRIKIKTFKIILIFILILCSYFGFKIYRASMPLNINIVKVDEQINSNKLLASFEANESLAEATFIEKVIVIEGIVNDVTYLNDRYTVILQSGNKFSKILCDMSSSQGEQVKKLKTGQSVSIKGVCKGYLLDVIMLNCILAKK